MNAGKTESTGTTEIERYMRACRADVDAALERFLPTPAEAPPLAIEAMRYSLFAGGKRLRPHSRSRRRGDGCPRLVPLADMP